MAPRQPHPGSTGADCWQPLRFAGEGAEVTDRSTGLVWQRCSHGLRWRDGAGCVGDIEAVRHAAATGLAAAAGPSWRLPTADELATLVRRDCGAPAIDGAVFPDVPDDPVGEGIAYWTATPAGLNDMVVTIDFSTGTADMHSRGLSYFVRLVRAPAEDRP